MMYAFQNSKTWPIGEIQLPPYVQLGFDLNISRPAVEAGLGLIRQIHNEAGIDGRRLDSVLAGGACRLHDHPISLREGNHATFAMRT